MPASRRLALLGLARRLAFVLALGNGSSVHAGPPALVVAPSGGFTESLRQLESAQLAADDDPVHKADDLRLVLRAVNMHAAELERDPKARRLRTLGQLTLARAYLAARRSSDAIAVVDDLIRTARGLAVPVESFGPTLGELYRRRTERLHSQGYAPLIIECSVDCRVFVNEVELASRKASLLLGEYRIAVRLAAHAEYGDWQGTMTVGPAGTERRITWPPPAQAKPPAPAVPAAGSPSAVPRPSNEPVLAQPRSTAEPPAAAAHRVLPLWAEVTGIVLGAGALAAGVTLVRLHHTCAGDRNGDTQTCPILLNTLTGGMISLVVGGAVLTGGMVVLGVDASRRDAHRRRQLSTSIGVGWRF